MQKIYNCLHDSRIGGPHVRVLAVGKLLCKNRYETTAILPKNSYDAKQFFQEHRLDVRELKFAKIPNPKKLGELLKWFLMFPRDVLRFWNLFNEGNPDIVHVNSIYMVHAALAAKLSKTKIVWHLNDTSLPPLIAKLTGVFVKFIADEPVAAALSVGRYYGLKDNEFKVLYAPVNTKAIKPSNHSTSAETLKVGILANWSWIKGYDDFIEVIALLVSRSTLPVKAVCIGKVLENQKAYHQEVMAKSIELGIKENLEITGFVEKPAELLRTLDMLLLTSRSEACPISVLEAMACSVPVVAFDVGGIKEQLLRDNLEAGIVVGKRDVGAMAKAVLSIADNPSKKAMLGQNGRSVAESVFDIQAVTESHMRVYASALSKE